MLEKHGRHNDVKMCSVMYFLCSSRTKNAWKKTLHDRGSSGRQAISIHILSSLFLVLVLTESIKYHTKSYWYSSFYWFILKRGNQDFWKSWLAFLWNWKSVGKNIIFGVCIVLFYTTTRLWLIANDMHQFCMITF